VMNAYDKVYLEKARAVLGRMLDFAVHDLGYSLEKFYGLFLASGIADRFGAGDYTVLVGKSGVELAYDVLEQSGIQAIRVKPNYPVDRSVEYWTGWALAYYQWETGLTFAEIDDYVPIRRVADLYHPFHEMDIRQFSDKMNELYRAAKPDTNLKLYRKKAGLTQKELADVSGVPLRTIQQYEQRQKNINKAQAEYLVMLARVLCCDVEAILEKV
jgi:DNA-binding transcriptional regulator YiaG